MWTWTQHRTRGKIAWSHTYDHCVFTERKVAISLTIVSVGDRLAAYVWEVPLWLN